ncbi:MAG: hypothetical protein ABI835_07615 [Chloroflexota bacterium]
MAFHTHNPALLKELDAMMSDFPEAQAGKLFGFPGYKVAGKMAVCVHEDGLLLKLGAARAQELIGTPGIAAFAAQENRPWKDWIKVTGKLADYRGLIEESLKYVAESA